MSNELLDTIEVSQYQRRLMVAVINQAFIDLCNRRRKRDEQIARAEAIEYLLEDEEDFPIVCKMAGLDPERVRAQARRVLERGYVVRRSRKKPAGMMPSYQFNFDDMVRGVRAMPPIAAHPSYVSGHAGA